MGPSPTQGHSAPLQRLGEILEEFCSHRRWVILSVILLSIAIQTIFFQFLPPALNRNENGDYFSFYGPVASNLEAGNGLLDRNGNFAIHYPPGFPLVLAFQFKVAGILGVEALSVIAVFNVLISAVSCACVFFIAENVFARRAALLAALAWATYPPNVWLSVQPNSEIPYLPLYFLSVVAALRALKEMNPKLAVKAGIFVGLAALVRPIALTSAVFLAAGLVLFSRKEFRRKGIASGALLLAAFLFMTAPWELCVYAKTGRSLPMFAKASWVVTQGLTSVITDAPGKPPTPGEVSRSKRGVVSLLIDQLKANPGPILKLLSMKLVRGWYGMYRSRRTNQILPVQLFYLLMAAIGLRGAIRDGRYHLPGIWLLLLSIAGGWLTTVITVPLLRYMIPQMPLVLIFFAFAFDQLLFEPRRPVRPPIAA